MIRCFCTKESVENEQPKATATQPEYKDNECCHDHAA